MRATRNFVIVTLALALLLPAATAAQVYVKNNYLGVGNPNPIFPLVVWEPGNPTFSFKSTTQNVVFNFKINSIGEFSISKANDTPAGALIRGLSRGAPNAVIIGGDIAATGFNTVSSRTRKENFTALNSSDVLARVVDLPLTRWNFKDDPNATPHLGPMAEDFYAAFGVGVGDSHIAVNDLGGVALAAIQGLHAEIETKDQQIEDLLRRVEELESRLGGR